MASADKENAFLSPELATRRRHTTAVFSAGSLGLDLDPVITSASSVSMFGGAAAKTAMIGCRVTGLRACANGSPGQAELAGVSVGDILFKLNGTSVIQYKFHNIMKMLKLATMGR